MVRPITKLILIQAADHLGSVPVRGASKYQKSIEDRKQQSEVVDDEITKDKASEDVQTGAIEDSPAAMN